MYSLQPTDEYSKRLRKWPKKHRRELLAMLNNLDTVVKALNKGARRSSLQFGFLHNEPMSIKAVDQKGGGAGLRECRLYFLVEEERETVYLLTMGDKSTQQDDIDTCKELVGSLTHG